MGLLDNNNNLLLKQKKAFNKLPKKERLDEITELNNETSFHDLIYYYRNMCRKRFNHLENGIDDMKLDEAKKCQNMFLIQV